MHAQDLFSDEQSLYFPKTRFQGSKRKVLPEIAQALQRNIKGTALDLYSGSGTVTLLLRQLGYKVIANDYLRFANNTAQLFLSLDAGVLQDVDWSRQLTYLLDEASLKSEPLIRDNYSGIFFTDDENLQIDRFCQNLDSVCRGLEKQILIYAVGQALLMKRPYNLFHRANLYMRLQDVKRTFGNHITWAKPIKTHALGAIQELRKVPIRHPASQAHKVTCVNTSNLQQLSCQPDIVYLDPPYIPARTIPVDYADFYNFLEGLVDYSLFKQPARDAMHRPIVNLPTRWLDASAAEKELEEISESWPDATIVMSYRDDGQPSVDRLLKILSTNLRKATVVDTKKYKYALSHSQTTHEVIIVAG